MTKTVDGTGVTALIPQCPFDTLTPDPGGLRAYAAAPAALSKASRESYR
jgi:hypothetical protein